ncbi:MAG: threonine synthase [Clostridia bacterium]
MAYISTRNKADECQSSVAIVNGLSKDGGLFVPSSFPRLSKKDYKALLEMDYPERTAFVLAKFMEDFTYEELLGYTQKAYSRFDGEDTCPLMAITEDIFILELWHGPTCAFKDMALTVLPYLMTASRQKTNQTNRTLILVATSGDTGKAALEGFKDVPDTDIIVFYPSSGVSDMQKMQMMTQEGKNVFVCAIEGNFDDAQSAVKTIFNDAETIKFLESKGYRLSSANSINWGRLAPQIAYYISSYCDMLNADEITEGEKINFCVPSGNFGNILAGYYAKCMGLPIGKLICASNQNNILTDFFTTGNYNTKRKFYKTMSPSMDILVSSNLERLLFEMSGRDDKFVAQKMKELKESGAYAINFNDIKNMDFIAGCANEEQTSQAIADFYDEYDYLLDPHTAVAMSVYNDYVAKSGDKSKTVIVSTASAFKFPCDVLNSIEYTNETDAYAACDRLKDISCFDIPKPLANLKGRKILYKKVIDKKDIKQEVINYVNNKQL